MDGGSIPPISTIRSLSRKAKVPRNSGGLSRLSRLRWRRCERFIPHFYQGQPGLAATAGDRGDHPRARRPDRPPPQETRQAHRLRARAAGTLPRTQCRRTLLQPPQAMAGPRNEIRQDRPQLPRCPMPGRHPPLAQHRVYQPALGRPLHCWAPQQLSPPPGSATTVEPSGQLADQDSKCGSDGTFS